MDTQEEIADLTRRADAARWWRIQALGVAAILLAADILLRVLSLPRLSVWALNGLSVLLAVGTAVALMHAYTARDMEDAHRHSIAHLKGEDTE